MESIIKAAMKTRHANNCKNKGEENQFDQRNVSIKSDGVSNVFQATKDETPKRAFMAESRNTENRNSKFDFGTESSKMWLSKKVVLVGDSRALNLNDVDEVLKPTNLVRYVRSSIKIDEMIEKVDTILRNNAQKDDEMIDLIVMVGLHCDMTCFKPLGTTGCQIMVPNQNINIEELILKIGKKIQQWTSDFPYCQIVITVPFIPHFDRYNSKILKEHLNTEQLNQVYPYRMSCEFVTQMEDILNQFFKCWDSCLNPRPLALARLENYLFNKVKKGNGNKRQSYRGRTTDGLHFAGPTIRYFWKLVKTHCQLMNKMPGRNYKWYNSFGISRNTTYAHQGHTNVVETNKDRGTKPKMTGNVLSQIDKSETSARQKPGSVFSRLDRIQVTTHGSGDMISGIGQKQGAFRREWNNEPWRSRRMTNTSKDVPTHGRDRYRIQKEDQEYYEQEYYQNVDLQPPFYNPVNSSRDPVNIHFMEEIW